MEKINLNQQEKMNAITNALWYKFAADQLSRTASNYESNIWDNYETSVYERYFGTLVRMCSGLVNNNRRHIPYYLSVMAIEDANDLRSWLNYLKKEEILDDEEVEILCNDYKSLVEEIEQGD